MRIGSTKDARQGLESLADEARERVLAILSRLPGAGTLAYGDHLSLQVGKKRFGWFLADHHGDGRIAVNCKASVARRKALLTAHPTFAHVPKYVGRHGWVGLWLDSPGTDWAVVENVLTDAYRMTAPKRLAATLEPASDA